MQPLALVDLPPCLSPAPSLPLPRPLLSPLQGYKVDKLPALETLVYMEKANCELLIMTQCSKCHDKSYQALQTH